MKTCVLFSYPRSGNTWIRYLIEILSARPTLGTPDNPNDLPICQRHPDLPVDQNGLAAALKRHTFDQLEIGDDRRPLIVVLRNYKEALLRVRFHSEESDRTFDFPRESRLYFEPLEYFDRHRAEKMLLPYEELIAEPFAAIRRLSSFLEAPEERLEALLEKYEFHRGKSLGNYHAVSGSHTFGEKALFHSLRLTAEVRESWDREMEASRPALYNRYLLRYRETGTGPPRVRAAFDEHGSAPVDINESFPHKVCINLDRRPERWQRMRERFECLGIRDVERFGAIDCRDFPTPPGWRSPPGAYACLQSHLAVVRRARAAGLPHVLIFEDDVLFAEHFNARFSGSIGGLPDDWDMVLLGSLLSRKPAMVSSGIGRVRKAHSTFAYALKHTIFDAFIELNARASQPVDNNNTLLQERFNCYAFYPFLAWVEDGYSDVEGAAVAHWQIRESLVLKSPEMDGLLARTSVIVILRAEGEPHFNSSHLEFQIRSLRSISPELAVVIVQPASVPDRELDAWRRCTGLRIRKQTMADLDGSALDAAREERQKGKHTFCFLDYDIFLRIQDMKGSVQMAQCHDAVRPFTSMITLGEKSTRELLDGNIRWVDESREDRREGDATFPGTWIVGGRLLDALSSWPPTERDLAKWRLFKAPATAARLDRRIGAP